VKIGYWTPVYGGFLRNVGDEGMPATFDYIRQVSQLADRLGYDITLVPELYLNDRKGVDAPSLEAWSLSSAIAAVTFRLRIMTAVRPGFHLPTVIAKTSASTSIRRATSAMRCAAAPKRAMWCCRSSSPQRWSTSTSTARAVASRSSVTCASARGRPA
jgi:FMNH2-dependent dimethyl sulfone monooxygenase